MKNIEHYKYLADMFRYPHASLYTVVTNARELLTAMLPGSSVNTDSVLESLGNMSVREQQEYYLKTFDVQAVCYLDIGYLMFGEDYKRAQLLVNLQSEHQAAGVDCGSELGDHLPNVLCLLAETRDEDFAEELGYIITTPAVKFMHGKFKNIPNYYMVLLEILLEFLQNDFKGEGLKEFAIPEQLLDNSNEFVLQSPKSQICQTSCNRKSH